MFANFIVVIILPYIHFVYLKLIYVICHKYLNESGKEKKRKDKTRKDMIQSTAQGGLLARLINQHRLSLLWARVWTEQLGGSGGREEEAGSGHARPRRLQQNTHMAYCMHRGELSHTQIILFPRLLALSLLSYMPLCLLY